MPKLIRNRTQPLEQPILLCDTCNKPTPHIFVGKNHIYQNKLAGERLMHQYKCLVCGELRYWGNEIVPGQKPRLRHANYAKQ
jgi:uncharacterized protein CbrC (UPF0167 family)